MTDHQQRRHALERLRKRREETAAAAKARAGQLLDYRRFESSSMQLAVLLPYRPSEDLMDLILKVPASVVWRTKNGFKRNDP